jgi:antitoxin component YwqK of YwqJK toxin-antitoxin module
MMKPKLKNGPPLFPDAARFRRLFFLLSLLCVSFPLCLSPQAARAGEKAWYTSNSIGTLLQPINDPGAFADGGIEYVLSVSGKDGREIRTLFDKDGKEVRRWERRYSETGSLEEETVFVEGAKDSLTFYYPSGLVKEEVLFTNDQEDGRFLFSYAGYAGAPDESAQAEGAITPAKDYTKDYKKSAPLSVSFLRPQETGGFRDEYQYLPSGDFRGIKRIYDDGAVYTSIFNLDNGILRDEWHSFGGLEILFHYDKRGNALYSEEYRDSVLVERSDFRYDMESPFRLREKRIRDAASGRETVLEYGEDGNPARESILEGGVGIEVTLFTYSGNFLVRKEIRRRTNYEEWEYFYNDDKDLVREHQLRGGEMYMSRVYDPQAAGGEEEYSRIDEYFRNGEVFLRLYFKDGEEVKREIPGEDNL